MVLNFTESWDTTFMMEIHHKIKMENIYYPNILIKNKTEFVKNIGKCIFALFYTIILLTISRYRDIMQVKGEIIRCLYYQDFTELLSVCIFSSQNIIRRISMQFTVTIWLQYVLTTVLFYKESFPRKHLKWFLNGVLFTRMSF